MSDTPPPEKPAEASVLPPESEHQHRARDQAVASMVTASVLAITGTLIFAWALRESEYQWLFAAGAVPWVVGVLVFARALWSYTRA